MRGLVPGTIRYSSPKSQTVSGAHPASYLMITEVLSPAGKQPGREANNPPPPNANVNKTGNVRIM